MAEIDRTFRLEHLIYKEDRASTMMEHLDLASEALKVFSLYAEKMERLPYVNDVLVLRLFSDGSGCICNSRESRRVYLNFTDLKDLLTQLKQLNT